MAVTTPWGPVVALISRTFLNTLSSSLNVAYTSVNQSTLISGLPHRHGTSWWLRC